MATGLDGSPPQAQVRAVNIGGIDETSVTLEPGINVLAGRNATNRTSFLRALIATLGGTDVSLKGNEDEGEAVLEFGNEEYRRTLRRQNGQLQFDGDPYDPEATAGHLFAFLLEDNEARQAVVQKDDLREVIMRPVDRANLEAQIRELTERKREIDDELERLESLKDRKTDLVERRSQLEDELEETEAELEDKRKELESMDRPLSESKDIENQLDDALDDLKAAESDLDDVEFRLETERESLDALRSERAEVEEELESFGEEPDEKLEGLSAEIDRLRDHKRSLDATTSQLQRIIQFNQQMLDGDRQDVQNVLGATPDDVTQQLVEDTVICWTCGSEVERSSIEDTVSALQDLREEKATERNEIQATLEDRKDEKNELEQAKRQRRKLERRLDELEDEIEQRQGTIADLEDRRDELESQVEELEATVADLEEEEQSEVLAVHRAVNELEFECERIESELQDIEETIEETETEIARIGDLEAERESINTELTDLRTRIERLETEAVEAFNEHMETVLDVLAYDNIDRIWIERTEETVREGRRKVTRSLFDLHVVRTTESGTAYEDTVEHLSESEREVTGLVFALAGYLVHDVHEDMPFMLLDSLEAIDSDRIARLIEYFEEYTPYLVVALLPEDAAALDGDYNRITGL
jgi:chromosome segregation ATPase